MARTTSASPPPPLAEASAFAPLTEDDVRARTDTGSFTRGRFYFREGRIQSPVLREDTLEAQCQGSEDVPYRVRATLLPRGEPGENPLTADCSCPRGGFCKHIVALLLTWIDDPERFAARPSLADQLGERSREELVALIVRLVQRYPDLERLVELPLPVPRGEGGASSANQVTVDVANIRGQVRAAFQGLHDDSYDNRWGVVGFSPGDLDSLVELGQSYAAAGQWANAQVVFMALVEEIGETMANVYDEEGQLSGYMAECDQGLADCLDVQPELPEDQRLSPEAREAAMASLFDIWHLDIFGMGGIGMSQYGPDAIARNATDEERSLVEGWLDQEQPDGWGKRAQIGFRVMLREASGLDDEELLTIYREAELWEDVAAMLLRMDRVGEAVTTAARYLEQPHSLLAFASALIERGDEHVTRAISLVDDRVWESEGTKAVNLWMLEEWLVAQYSIHDRPKDALTMAERRFRQVPALSTFQAVRHAAQLPGQADGAWENLLPDLLGHLREKKAWVVLVDVHLDEGDVEAALGAYDKQGRQRQADRWYGESWGQDDQPTRLARAAEQDFPDQAVSIYRGLANDRIERRQRSNYQVAAGYLERARETLERHGRKDEWHTLITELREENKKLRALREELDNLGLR